jgi:hypothetical protein
LGSGANRTTSEAAAPSSTEVESDFRWRGTASGATSFPSSRIGKRRIRRFQAQLHRPGRRSADAGNLDRDFQLAAGHEPLSGEIEPAKRQVLRVLHAHVKYINQRRRPLAKHLLQPRCVALAPSGLGQIGEYIDFLPRFVASLDQSNGIRDDIRQRA